MSDAARPERGHPGDSADAGTDRTRPVWGAVLASLIDLATVSPWAYAAIVALVALDAVFPLVPGEAAVISAAALAGSGELSLGCVVAAAVLGAVAGDNGAFAAGRVTAPRVERRLSRSGSASRARAWVEAKMDARGPTLVVLSRFVPGGRTAVTATAGLIGMRWSRFLPLSVVGGIAWAVYVVSIGYAGGSMFEEHPALGLVLGFVLALAVTAAVSLAVRRHGNGDATDARA